MDSTYWRKSSYSGGQGGNCVEVGGRPKLRRTAPVRNCAEPGEQARVVLVRDTQDRDGGQLAVSAAAWRAFTQALG
jgi:hypothetical protein